MWPAEELYQRSRKETSGCARAAKGQTEERGARGGGYWWGRGGKQKDPWGNGEPILPTWETGVAGAGEWWMQGNQYAGCNWVWACIPVIILFEFLFRYGKMNFTQFAGAFFFFPVLAQVIGRFSQQPGEINYGFGARTLFRSLRDLDTVVNRQLQPHHREIRPAHCFG